jgi:hypothetical protein
MKVFRVQKIQEVQRGRLCRVVEKNRYFGNLIEAFKCFKNSKGTDVYLDNLLTNKTLISK